MKNNLAVNRVVLSVAMLLYVIIATTYFVSLKFMNGIDVKDHKNHTVQFKHPVFQVVCGFSLEFVIVVCLYWPFDSLLRGSGMTSQTSFL